MKLLNKKLIAVIVLSVTMMGLISGCTAAKNNTVNTETVSNSNKAPVEIEFWYGLGGKLGENMVQKIKEFNESQKEVVVKGVAQGSYTETYQALQAAIASKKAPAAVLLNNVQMNSLGSKKVLAPLDDFISKDKNFNSEDFIPSFYNQGKINGKIYSLPMYGTTQVMYYRKDYLESAGIKPEDLKTWEDVFSASKKLRKTNGNEVSVYGFEPMWGPENLTDMALSKGGKIISEDGKNVLIDSNEWIDTWESIRKAIHEDKTMRIHSGGQGWEYWYATIDDVMKDRAAGYLGSSGDQGDLDFSKIVAAPQPGWNGHAATPIAEALTVSIPAVTDKDKQEAAFKWMKFFTSAEKTADWSIKTGYIAVRKSAEEAPVFKEFAKTHPQILVPIAQAKTASSAFVDPTGGKISDALKKAADKVEIQNINAAQALKEAKEEAQAALNAASK
ncbi:ABC transporter substrate-binding protein [Clostridium sp. DJ247]|uniref:ABC transporter substrate-binding protein n=1 Tax=Clostridium sp. DJ247 TaxID=2726188 RepID=UPI0016237CAC|nr:ABC transporter substrate-binding protein [Clostridium sp. DJ247]MBC2579459.1 ABC transporter substrate-binding protein [Clostridium sp. DJ247]